MLQGGGKICTHWKYKAFSLLEQEAHDVLSYEHCTITAVFVKDRRVLSVRWGLVQTSESQPTITGGSKQTEHLVTGHKLKENNFRY